MYPEGLGMRATAGERSPLAVASRCERQAAGLWQTASMLCPSGPMTKAA